MKKLSVIRQRPQHVASVPTRTLHAVDPLLPNSRLQAIKKLLGERIERDCWWRRWLQ